MSDWGLDELFRASRKALFSDINTLTRTFLVQSQKEMNEDDYPDFFKVVEIIKVLGCENRVEFPFDYDTYEKQLYSSSNVSVLLLHN